jgi:hypothetical protein
MDLFIPPSLWLSIEMNIELVSIEGCYGRLSLRKMVVIPILGLTFNILAVPTLVEGPANILFCIEPMLILFRSELPISGDFFRRFCFRAV